jgi:hypothetical protein
VRDAVQPARECLTAADAGGLTGEDHEDSLVDILRVGGVAEQTPAYTPDHRPMPPEEQLKRRSIPAADEAGEQFGIAHTINAGLGGRAKLDEQHR